MPYFEKMTPILTMTAIEPCLPFWLDVLGFVLIDQVDHGGTIGFAILQRDGVTLMLQSIDSIKNDGFMPEESVEPCLGLLYVNVRSLDEIAARLPAEVIVCPRRTTFYGAEEIFVKDPAGNVVGLAEHKSVEVK